jgi:hypothetical protein
MTPRAHYDRLALGLGVLSLAIFGVQTGWTAAKVELKGLAAWKNNDKLTLVKKGPATTACGANWYNHFAARVPAAGDPIRFEEFGVGTLARRNNGYLLTSTQDSDTNKRGMATSADEHFEADLSCTLTNNGGGSYTLTANVQADTNGTGACGTSGASKGTHECYAKRTLVTSSGPISSCTVDESLGGGTAIYEGTNTNLGSSLGSFTYYKLCVKAQGWDAVGDCGGGGYNSLRPNGYSGVIMQTSTQQECSGQTGGYVALKGEGQDAPKGDVAYRVDMEE